MKKLLALVLALAAALVLLPTASMAQTKSKLKKPATGYQEVLAGRAQVTITSNVEAATLMKTYPDLQQVGASSEMRNKRPFAYPLPQGDEVWLTFVNNWISLKEAEGYFAALEAKWLTAKK